MAERDYYDILGVPRDAPPEDVKRAYRKAAFQWHPDRNAGNPEAEKKFKELAEAYDVLGDPGKRAQYDRFGREGVRAGGFAAREFTDVEDIFRHFRDIFGGGSIFEEFFGTPLGGGPKGATRVRKGTSLRVEVPLTLEEVAQGARKTIALAREELCEPCRGSGARPGTASKTCSACRGRGVVEQMQGFFSLRTTCPHCGGEGSVVEHPCASCRGAGRVRRRREISVRLPAGADEGTLVRLSGEGEPGTNGGPNGDLFVVVRLTPHPIFERRGADLYCEVPVRYATLALGGKVTVPTLGENAQATVPRGTPSGKVLRLRGLGLPSVDGPGRGDLLVRAFVEVPRKTTAREEVLLRELDEIERRREGTRDRSFFARVKEIFE